MGRMSELATEIGDMLDEGYKPATIAVRLNVPVRWVYDIAFADMPDSPPPTEDEINEMAKRYGES